MNCDSNLNFEIRKIFGEVSRHIWEKKQAFLELNIKPKEEYLTEDLLFEIRKRNSPSIEIFGFTKNEESKYGADIEFWIGQFGRGYVGFSAQAKVLGYPHHRYDSLNHKAKGKPQIDLLENYAQANRTIPMYLLYNYVPNSELWNCSKEQEQKILGCTITDLEVIREVLAPGVRGKRNYFEIHSKPQTIPLRCLLCHGENGLMALLINRILNQPNHRYLHSSLPEYVAVKMARQLKGSIEMGAEFLTRKEIVPKFVCKIEIEDENNVSIEHGSSAV